MSDAQHALRASEKRVGQMSIEYITGAARKHEETNQSLFFR
jgi:hypothetical protein